MIAAFRQYCLLVRAAVLLEMGVPAGVNPNRILKRARSSLIALSSPWHYFPSVSIWRRPWLHRRIYRSRRVSQCYFAAAFANGAPMAAW